MTGAAHPPPGEVLSYLPGSDTSTDDLTTYSRLTLGLVPGLWASAPQEKSGRPAGGSSRPVEKIHRTRRLVGRCPNPTSRIPEIPHSNDAAWEILISSFASTNPIWLLATSTRTWKKSAAATISIAPVTAFMRIGGALVF